MNYYNRQLYSMYVLDGGLKHLQIIATHRWPWSLNLINTWYLQYLNDLDWYQA